MDIVEVCRTYLQDQLALVPMPVGKKLEIGGEDGCLELIVYGLDEEQNLVPTSSATFVRASRDEPNVSSEKLTIWAAAFVRAQLDEPALSQASPGLLYRDELVDEEAMLAAMRDPDYALFAEQILEAEGSKEDQFVLAIQSGNWLWVEELLRNHPELTTLRPDGESLFDRAAECLEPGGARVIDLLRDHGVPE
ncbi:MAG: hypothetical protein Q8Q09_08505 [Deltaproteobacteria bacterium]|nr:hypothetical protein [Deltaproteobacteria bacterium]